MRASATRARSLALINHARAWRSAPRKRRGMAANQTDNQQAIINMA